MQQRRASEASGKTDEASSEPRAKKLVLRARPGDGSGRRVATSIADLLPVEIRVDASGRCTAVYESGATLRFATLEDAIAHHALCLGDFREDEPG